MLANLFAKSTEDTPKDTPTDELSEDVSNKPNNNAKKYEDYTMTYSELKNM